MNVVQWMGELDNLGIFASNEALLTHLERAPEGAPTWIVHEFLENRPRFLMAA